MADNAIKQVDEEKVEEIAGATPATHSFANEDAELAELQKQAAAAKEAPKTEPKVEPKVEPKADEKAADKAAVASTSAEQGAIIALRRKLSETTAHNLVLQGQVQAFSGLVKPAEEPKVEEPADTIDSIDAQYLAIAEQVDAGTKSEKEAEAERLALRKRERELLRQENERLLAAQAPQPVNDLGLQEHLAKLISDYPVLNTLSEEDLDPIAKLAIKQAEKEGKPIQEGPLGTKDLRERMARIAESFYDPKASAARIVTPPDVGTQKPGELSELAKAREAKLKMAAQMPPDIGKIGAGAIAGEVTEDQAFETLKAFGGNEDAQIKWLEQHPQFANKVMGRKASR